MSIQVRFIGIILGGIILCTACKNRIHEKKALSAADTVKGTYFSIKQFTADQFHTYHGYPFSFMHTTVLNGVKDSDVENMTTVDWGYILKEFFDADISDRKFIGKYTFSMFDDDATQTRNFLYEAKDPSLFTQKLQISADQFTDRIRNIYVETEEHSSSDDISQKLLYDPQKVIQIQRYEKGMIGKPKEQFIEYRFM